MRSVQYEAQHRGVRSEYARTIGRIISSNQVCGQKSPGREHRGFDLTRTRVLAQRPQHLWTPTETDLANLCKCKDQIRRARRDAPILPMIGVSLHSGRGRSPVVCDAMYWHNFTFGPNSHTRAHSDSEPHVVILKICLLRPAKPLGLPTCNGIIIHICREAEVAGDVIHTANHRVHGDAEQER